MNPTDVAIRSSPVASLIRTRSGERARMTFSVFRPVWLASAARPTARALSTSPGWWPKAPAELGDILLEQRRAWSTLLEVGSNGALPQVCDSKSAQPYGDHGGPREGD